MKEALTSKALMNKAVTKVTCIIRYELTHFNVMNLKPMQRTGVVLFLAVVEI